MSAMGYGGHLGSYVPPNPKDNAVEHTFLGPSLNAAAALENGWLKAHNFNVKLNTSAEFEISSRHVNSRIPHAIKVSGLGINTFVIEYRENYDLDQAQGE